MAATRCLYNSRAALYRVFVSPLEATEAAHVLGRSITLASQNGQLWRRQTPSGTPSSRTFSTSSPLSAPRPKRGTVVPDRLPIDFEIKDRQIMLIDLENKISGPHNTQQVLKSMDTAIFSLRMIKERERPQKPKPGASAEAQDQPPRRPPREGAEYALCRVVNKQDEWKREQQRSKDKKASERAAKIKELEINWAIAANDLALKTRQLKGFLEKGQRVDVMFATKKGARKAAVDEMQAVVTTVKEAAAEVPGARERKAREGDVGRKMFLFFEAQAQKTT